MNVDFPIRLSRRDVFGMAGFLAVPLTTLRASDSQAKNMAAGEIAQPTRTDPKGFVDRAFDLRRQAVATGDQVASVGNSGWSTEPHLHLEINETGFPLGSSDRGVELSR